MIYPFLSLILKSSNRTQHSKANNCLLNNFFIIMPGNAGFLASSLFGTFLFPTPAALPQNEHAVPDSSQNPFPAKPGQPLPRSKNYACLKLPSPWTTELRLSEVAISLNYRIAPVWNYHFSELPAKNEKIPHKRRMPGSFHPLAIIMKKLFCKLWLALSFAFVYRYSINGRNV